MMKIPKDKDRPDLFLPPQAAHLQNPFTGTGTAPDGSSFRIKDGIIDLMAGINTSTNASTNAGSNAGTKQSANADTKAGTKPNTNANTKGARPSTRLRSPAQLSNLIPLTAMVYEDLWRKRSLSILGREPFSLDEEFRILQRWLQPSAGKRYLDVGCSTALYGRTIKSMCKECDVVALDYSRPMLRQARKRAAQEMADLFLVRADARQMPFPDGTFDGLAMGGTLNELLNPMQVLRECRRVIRDDGLFFNMFLLKAEKPVGRAAQLAARLGGIHFPTKEESSIRFKEAGFRVKKRMSMGVVCMALLEPV